LAVSFSTIGWEVDGAGNLKSESPFRPATETVYKRLIMPGTQRGWSDRYKNPYITYTTETGENIFLWYEDERSVLEKMALARMFGINGVSLWRLGEIPNYDGYDVFSAIKTVR